LQHFAVINIHFTPECAVSVTELPACEAQKFNEKETFHPFNMFLHQHLKYAKVWCAIFCLSILPNMH
jgi:hypothetical protein